MAKQCEICGKGSILMKTRAQLLRGHYNPAGKKRKYPNLQKATIDGEKTTICTKCKKSL